ncbi:Cof-type HAD-IIB family hydrolase [Cellulomonas aerilata]|uniref:Haloacid dehalogenase n=1 Tax=Cellulomonas aerilata TaxID=515326 RepID=A0A512D9L7_9CELL|nr:Cof-type HAD-IIB family hydrolase [Cellulomonas aerilata]GEO33194.1 haloacid dehalogenase [Cellulomonas aerilata]
MTPDPGATEAAPDIRLITVDMDGTLLDEHHEIPASLWPLLPQLNERGVLFCPASGRQHANLATRFAPVARDLLIIAENGSYVAQGGVEISSATIDRGVVAEIVTAVRDLAADVGAVVCGKRSAYVERLDAPFLAECERYYTLLQPVDDLLAVDDDVLKVAVFDFGSAQHSTAPALERFSGTQQVVVSGLHWVDVMHPTTHKGTAVRAVQERYGITRAQTMAFGDYLNDLEMLDAAEHSYAMADAHPSVVARARHLAPSNREDGVVRTIREVLRLPAA